jgi:hypothetical protein
MAYRHEEKDEVIRGYLADDDPIYPACMEEELEEATKGDVLT